MTRPRSHNVPITTGLLLVTVKLAVAPDNCVFVIIGPPEIPRPERDIMRVDIPQPDNWAHQVELTVTLGAAHNGEEFILRSLKLVPVHV